MMPVTCGRERMTGSLPDCKRAIWASCQAEKSQICNRCNSVVKRHIECQTEPPDALVSEDAIDVVSFADDMPSLAKLEAAKKHIATYRETAVHGAETPDEFVLALSGKFADLTFVLNSVGCMDECIFLEYCEIRNGIVVRMVSDEGEVDDEREEVYLDEAIRRAERTGEDVFDLLKPDVS
jgi:hypothetical protein